MSDIFDRLGMEDASGEPGDDRAGEGYEGPKFYGKYRGTVLQNSDPERRCRLQLVVPDVSAVLPTTWAMPCVPVAGLSMGMYLVPPMGAGVWVEFEQGDPDYPIWVGCFWGIGAEAPIPAPITAPALPVIVMGMLTKSALVLSDVPVAPALPMPTGGITLMSGASWVTVDAKGVTITAPLITLNGVLNVNQGALMVT